MKYSTVWQKMIKTNDWKELREEKECTINEKNGCRGRQNKGEGEKKK